MLIRQRIFWGYIAIVILICLFIVFLIINRLAVRDDFSDLQGDIIPCTVAMSYMKSRVVEIRAWTMTYIIRGNRVRQGKPLKDSLKEQWADLKEQAKIHFEHEYHFHMDWKERQAAAVIVNLAKKFISVSAEVVELKDKGVQSEEELLEKVRIEFDPLFYPLNQLLDDNLAVNLNELAEAERDIQGRLKAISIYVPIAGFLISV